MKFASRRDAGEQLAVRVLAEGPWPDVLVLALGERGHDVAEPIATVLRTSAVTVELDADGDAPFVRHLPDVAARTVIVVADGVETGTAAHAMAKALDAAGADRQVLAVGVCPRDAMATLQFAFDQVIAVQKPMGRRALTWHYADESNS